MPRRIWRCTRSAKAMTGRSVSEPAAITIPHSVPRSVAGMPCVVGNGEDDTDEADHRGLVRARPAHAGGSFRVRGASRERARGPHRHSVGAREASRTPGPRPWRRPSPRLNINVANPRHAAGSWTIVSSARAKSFGSHNDPAWSENRLCLPLARPLESRTPCSPNLPADARGDVPPPGDLSRRSSWPPDRGRPFPP